MQKQIAAWDGKSAQGIDAIYQRYCDKATFVSDIIRFLQQVPLQKGASWLLKKYLETGGELNPADIKKIYILLRHIEHWESQLHILQCIPYMPISKGDKTKVELFLRTCLADSNKFVRTWAYNGFYQLAIQYPEYQEETKLFFEMAMRDEAASVKARIRNIMKKGF